MEMNLDLVLAMVLLLAFAGGLLARKIKAPLISGYLVVGMLLSPSITPILSKEVIDGITGVVTPIALGVIAFVIGGYLKLENLRGLKKTIAFISTFEAMGAWGFTIILVAFIAPLVVSFQFSEPGPMTFISLGLVAGAISLATAPVGTVSIAREYRTRGPVTTTLLGVVAVDNSIAIASYSLAIGIVAVLMGGSQSTLLSGIGLALGKIGLSWLLGGAFALGMIRLAPFAKRREELTIVVLGGILLCDGLAEYLGLSGLLATLALGVVTVNLPQRSEHLFEVINNLEELIYALFLALVGTHLDPRLLGSAGLLAALIVLGRMGGKFLGATVGATVAGAPVVVRKYLGMTLLAKAGVTVGLVMLIQRDLSFSPDVAAVLINGVLASTIINQLVAPPLVKFALVKAGEIGAAVAPKTEEPLPFDPMKVVTVGETMTRDYPTIPSTMPITELAHMFEESGHHGFPVVDDQGELCGVASITDVAQASVEGDMDLTVADIATTSLITAYPDQVLHDALRQWGAQDVSRILVIDRENPRQLLGVLRRRDIVAAYGKASRRWSDEQTRSRLARLTSDDETRLTEIDVSGGSTLIGQLIKDIRLPKECILVSITRGGNIIIPHGDTKLYKGDRITVFCALKAEAEVRKALTSP